MKEITELKKNRPRVSQVDKMQDAVENRDFGADFKGKIGNLNEELNMYRDGKRKAQEKLSALMETRPEQLGDLPTTVEERALWPRVRCGSRSTMRRSCGASSQRSALTPVWTTYQVWIAGGWPARC